MNIRKALRVVVFHSIGDIADWDIGACHREQFVNKSSFGLTGIVLRHIIRKIVFIGKAVYYDDQRPYIYQDQRT